MVVLALIALVLLACALARGVRSRGDLRLDAALWICTSAGELGLAAILWRLSTGGWFNYSLQAVVVGCVSTARRPRASPSSRRDATVARRDGRSRRFRPLHGPILNQVVAERRSEAADLARLLKTVKRPSTELFFVDLPGANRVLGRLDMVYDPWLYPVFESIGLAEPRSIWLEDALATGPVRIVATASSRPDDRRARHTLPELGYRPYGKAAALLCLVPASGC